MDASHWNERYATAEYVWKADPNVFLVAETEGLPPGRALDLACGEGRNAVWLAEQGWDATGVDFSDAGEGATSRGRPRCRGRMGLRRRDRVGSAGGRLRLRRRVLPAAAARGAPSGHGHRRPGPRSERDVARRGPRFGEPDWRRGRAQDPAVLYTPDDVLGDLAAAGIDATVERAETIERPVAGADRPALDCLVRARR
jgi:hypothetical protein